MHVLVVGGAGYIGSAHGQLLGREVSSQGAGQSVRRLPDALVGGRFVLGDLAADLLDELLEPGASMA